LYQKDLAIRREIAELLYEVDREILKNYDTTQREMIAKQREYGEISENQEAYLLQQHYNTMVVKQKALNGKYSEVVQESLDDVQKARLALMTEALSEEWIEIQDKLNERNQKELDAINKFYDDKIEAIQKGIDDERELYDEQDADEKRRELEKERKFLRLSFDKEAIDRVKEIDKELRQLDRDAKLKQMEEDAENQTSVLEKQRQIAIEVQEEINKKRLEDEKDAWEITSREFKASSVSIQNDIFELIGKVQTQSNAVADAGTNFVKRLVDGINAYKPDLKKSVDDLAQMLDFGTRLGEFKNTTDLFSNVSLARMSAPMNVSGGGSVLAFNAPILQVDTLVLNDKLDIETVGTEMWTAIQNKARADGSTVLGRV
jgi:hypothetical protein